MKIANIVWDTEDNGVVMPQDELGLPNELEVDEDEIVEAFGLDEDEDVMDYVADWLSDEYGWCVVGFDCQEVIDKKIEAMLKELKIKYKASVCDGALFLGSIELFLGEDGDVHCEFPGGSRPLRFSINDIKAGEAFLLHLDGNIHVSPDGAKQDNMGRWYVYDNADSIFFVFDMAEVDGERLKEVLGKVADIKKGTLFEEKIDSAYMRCDVDNNNGKETDYLKG